MFIASVAATAVLSLGGIVAQRGSFTASAQEKPASTAEVKIDNFSFGPAAITVSVGTTVIWINRDDIPHTVVSTEKVFKSKVLDTDEKFSYTFHKARRVSLLLLDPSEDDRESGRPVIAAKQSIDLEPL